MNMSRKKKTILDEVIGFLWSFIALCLIGIILSIYVLGNSAYSASANQSLKVSIIGLAISAVALIILSCVRRNYRKSLNRELSKASAHAKKLHREQVDKYRKWYGVAPDKELYFTEGIISDYPADPTDHERRIVSLLQRSEVFNPNCIFLDNHFKTASGKTVQVDLIAVSKRGILVIESKDYTGWIFGNGNQDRWTQVIYKDKFRFYNPIKQNENHINCLRSIIGDHRYYSLVIFGSGTELKDISYVPQNTFVAVDSRLNEVLLDICSREEVLTAEDVLEICRKIHKKRLIPTEKMREEHIRHIKDQTGEDRVYS